MNHKLVSKITLVAALLLVGQEAFVATKTQTLKAVAQVER